jgi:chromosome segregation ATPase
MADAKAEAAAVIDDLRERLQQAEVAAEEAQKQHAVTQARLDDTSKEHNSIEESMHEQEERLEQLEIEKKESIRQRREFEAIYEAERAQSMKEKEELQVREEELRDTIQRLKETMAQKEMRGEDERRQSISRACMLSRTLIV